ncbi:MAG: M15 family metallopeptidase, partial [Eubacterium sp.]
NVDVTNGYGGYKPGTNKFSVTQKVINIWKAHGFYWGGDWTGKKDTMHFSYTEKPG